MTDDQPPPKPAPRPRGLFCPVCRGVRLCFVRLRRPCPGVVTRTRVCSACGHRVVTEERVVRTPKPDTAPHVNVPGSKTTKRRGAGRRRG